MSLLSRRGARSDRAGRSRRDGERVLASCTAADGTELAGTRSALYLGEHRVPWHLVEASEWERDEETWRVSEVGTFGQPRPEHAFVLPSPGVFLELVRERVSATVVLQRRVAVHGKRGLWVIARRASVGDEPLTWIYEYDAGIDPLYPAVRQAAAQGLADAKSEVGLG